MENKGTVQRKILAGENFGELQAKLHLAKKTLADLGPASSFFRYYKQLADKTLANSQQIAKFAKIFCCTVQLTAAMEAIHSSAD